jgi:hypothetical protein
MTAASKKKKNITAYMLAVASLVPKDPKPGRRNRNDNMKITKTLLSVVAVFTVFATGTAVRADDLAAAAAKASKLVNRPVAASPHALEEFPWLLRSSSPPIVARHPLQAARTYPDNLATAAAKASALVNRPIVASPHGLEEFPGLLRGMSPQIESSQVGSTNRMFFGNSAADPAKASASSKRPIVPSTHRGDYP